MKSSFIKITVAVYFVVAVSWSIISGIIVWEMIH